MLGKRIYGTVVEVNAGEESEILGGLEMYMFGL